MLTEQEKIKLAEEAFQKFRSTVMMLLAEQRVLFEKILKRTEERKIAEHREQIKTIYNPQDKDSNNSSN